MVLGGATASGPRAARGVACEGTRGRHLDVNEWTAESGGREKNVKSRRHRVKRATCSGQKCRPTAGRKRKSGRTVGNCANHSGKERTHFGRKSGPTADKKDHNQLQAKIGEGGWLRQADRRDPRSGSQPRYGGGRIEDQRSLRRVEARVRGAGA